MTEIIGGHYQIVKHLGGGGFGQTFIARDTHLPGQPLCVVKLLMPLTRQGSEVIPLPKDTPTFQVAERLFNKEAQTLYKLGEHDQIPRLLAHFEENKDFFLVQQLIEGQNLGEEMSGKKYNETQVIDLSINILTPLAFVHQHKVIHRDLKPDNLIRRKKDGKIVLIDFGAVKEVITQTTSAREQSRTIAIGTPGYMPIEQCNGKPTLSSDVYAVGIIAIQALTGLYPTQIPSDPTTGQIHWQELVSVSPKLREILDRMICEDFRQRYQSAKEALQAVSSITNKSENRVSSQPVTTHLINNQSKSAINRKLITSFVSLILIVVVGFFIFTRSPSFNPSEKTSPQKETPAF